MRQVRPGVWEDEPMGEPSFSRVREFIREIIRRTPNGEQIKVQYHPNGDWGVAAQCEPSLQPTPERNKDEVEKPQEET
jgi:hypothetical protein